MNLATLKFALVLSALAFATSATAQISYPAKGQSASKQSKDEAACSKWATQQTGFDPSHPPPAEVEPEKVTGSGTRLVGAAAGGVVAGVAGGNAGTGALVGATVGGVSRRVKNRRAADAQNEANAQYHGASQASYVQARTACMTGRGYSVK